MRHDNKIDDVIKAIYTPIIRMHPFTRDREWFILLRVIRSTRSHLCWAGIQEFERKQITLLKHRVREHTLVERCPNRSLHKWFHELGDQLFFAMLLEILTQKNRPNQQTA